MENNIRYYVDEIFAETTPSRKSVELKEEMIQNLQDKYNDLLSEGKTPEAAYNIVVAGIGDVSALLGELENDRTPQGNTQREENRRISAMFTAVAVSMYILSVLPVILLRNLTGVVILIAMAAIATGLLVFNSIVRPGPRDDDEDSMVEEFRAWRAGTHEQRSMMKAISSAMWSIVVALYFIISFTTGAWHITWVIFLIAAAAQSLIKVFWPIGR